MNHRKMFDDVAVSIERAKREIESINGKAEETKHPAFVLGHNMGYDKGFIDAVELIAGRLKDQLMFDIFDQADYSKKKVAYEWEEKR